MPNKKESDMNLGFKFKPFKIIILLIVRGWCARCMVYTFLREHALYGLVCASTKALFTIELGL